MSTADGSWVGGDDWKARVDASVTTNNADKAVITVKCICVSDYGTTAGYNNLQGGTAYGNNSYNWGSATSISTDQTKQMASKTYMITKTHSAQSIKCWAKVKGISGLYDGSSSEASVNVTVSAKTSYTVSYNANGGTGSMANSQKWYGESLTLRSNTFTRTGYTFKGWATSASGGVSYANGAAYTGNAALTLYAVWQANTWAVSYNANGGSGAPASQTKTYGQTLALRSEIPTLANHEFVEWNTAANGSGTSYAPGGSYTTNGAVTLYAQWRMAYNLPTIENLEVVRYDQTSGQDSDEGTDMRVSFDWTVDTTSLPDTNNDISTTNTYVEYRQKGSSGSWTRLALTIDTTNKTASVITNTGLFDQASSYDVYVVVADTHGTTRSITTILSTTTYIFDVAAGGQGMSIGKPCASSGLHVAWDSDFDGDIQVANNKSIFGTDTNGNAVYALEPCNSGNNCTLGYGGYDASQGSTNIYGNHINLYAKVKVILRNRLAFPDATALPSAGTSTNFYAIGINAFSDGGLVSYKGLADVKTWLGMGSVDYTNSSWTTPATGVHYRKRAGWVIVVFDGVTWTGTGDATKFTLPAGYRPGKKINMLSVNGSNANVYAYVSTDGVVKFHRSSSSNSTYYNGTMVFPADN